MTVTLPMIRFNILFNSIQTELSNRKQIFQMYLCLNIIHVIAAAGVLCIVAASSVPYIMFINLDIS